MDDHCNKMNVPLSAFIIKQCRKFRLFANESTTVLSRGDELQVMQYCLACQNRKNGGKLEADSNTAATLVDKIRKSAVLSIEQTLLISQREKTIRSHTSHVAVVPGSSKEAISTVDSNDETANPTVNVNTTDNTKYHDGKTNKFVEEIQNNIKNKDTSLKDGQISNDGIELCQDSDHLSTMESSVLALFHNYKETNNHWALMDVYSIFIKAMINQNSDIHQAISANEDVYKLESEMGSCCIMQIKVIEFLQDICNVSTRLQHEVVSSLAQLPSLEASNHALLLSPKTPVGKVRAAADFSARSPAEVGTPKTPFSPLSGRGLKEIFVEDLFRSYMHLLVNSRSQLALARVFNIPDRGLDHEAFTHLKHEASSCGLSMYQTLSSFMLRIQLGGQGYAPTKDNPLMLYVKGLGSLLDMTQKLQVIIEEVYELRAACSRIVNVVKNNLIQCKSGKFPSKLVTPVSGKIHDVLSTIIQDMESINKDCPDKATINGSNLLGHQCLLVIQQFLDRTSLCESQLDLHLMNDISFSSSSPARFPCLLTQFRSPSIMDVKDNDDSDNTKSISNRRYSVPGSRKHFVSAALYVDSEQSTELLLTQRTMNSIEILPSKTICHPRAVQVSCNTTSAKSGRSTLSDMCKEVSKCVKTKGNKRRATSSLDKENLITSPAQHVPEPNQKFKRKESSSTNVTETSSNKSEQTQSSQGMSDNKLKKSGMSCRRRLMTQIKGQGKITGFFRQ